MSTRKEEILAAYQNQLDGLPGAWVEPKGLRSPIGTIFGVIHIPAYTTVVEPALEDDEREHVTLTVEDVRLRIYSDGTWRTPMEIISHSIEELPARLENLRQNSILELRRALSGIDAMSRYVLGRNAIDMTSAIDQTYDAVR